MPTTTTTRTVTTVVRLSCNHVFRGSQMGDSAFRGSEWIYSHLAIGDTLGCTKCPQRASGEAPVRRVKHVETGTVTLTSEQQALVDSAMTPVPAPTPQAIADVQKVIDAAAASTEGYDVMAARDEWSALKAWRQAGGSPGQDRPATPNLDALNDAHAAGKPRSGARATKAPRQARTVDPVRQAANEARKTKGAGGRHNLRRVTNDELVSYIRGRLDDHANSRSVDLRDYALWVDEVSVSFKRWDAAYATIVGAAVLAALWA